MLKQCIAVGVLSLAAGSVSAQQVFFSDFSSGQPAEITGDGSIQGTQGFSAYGFGSNFFRNSAFGNPAGATVLTLSNLPVHNRIEVNFLLAIIDSWDSTDGNPSPDFFNVEIDGVNVFQATFSNASGSVEYVPPPNGLLANNAALGFGSFNDDAYAMAFEPALHNIPHTSSTVTIRFFASGAGWQGGDDESFAIDDLRIVVTQVPTPSAGALALIGTLGIASRRKRK